MTFSPQEIIEQNKTVGVHSFGTVMLEEAMKNGIKDRDELRKLSIDKQKELQKMAPLHSKRLYFKSLSLS